MRGLSSGQYRRPLRASNDADMMTTSVVIRKWVPGGVQAGSSVTRFLLGEHQHHRRGVVKSAAVTLDQGDLTVGFKPGDRSMPELRADPLDGVLEILTEDQTAAD